MTEYRVLILSPVSQCHFSDLLPQCSLKQTVPYPQFWGASSPAVKHEFNNLGFNDPHIQHPWIQQSWIQQPSHSTILGFNNLGFNDPHLQQSLDSTTLGFNNLEFNNLGFNKPWIQQS